MALGTFGTSNFAYTPTSPVTAFPFTLAGWFRNTLAINTGFSSTILCVGASGGASIVHLVVVGTNDAAPGGVGVGSLDVRAVAPSSAISTAIAHNQAWHHACAVFTSTTSRAAYLDGVNKGTNATSNTPAGLDVLGIGCRNNNGARSIPWRGDLAELGIWNVALTDAEVAALGNGLCPLAVRPGSLLSYFPMVRGSAPVDRMGRSGAVTVDGTLGPLVHPRIIVPGMPQFRRGSRGLSTLAKARGFGALSGLG